VLPMQTKRTANFSCWDNNLDDFQGQRNTIKCVASRCYESTPYSSMPNTLNRQRRPIDELEEMWPRYVIASDQMSHCEGRFAEHGLDGRGVYFLWGEQNALLYVGTTYDLQARLVQHDRTGKVPYVGYSFLEVEMHPACDLAEWVEGCYIDALEPPYNRRPGRCGFLGRGKMIEQIRAAWEACRYDPNEEAHAA
jgi:hypothetical protein